MYRMSSAAAVVLIPRGRDSALTFILGTRLNAPARVDDMRRPAAVGAATDRPLPDLFDERSSVEGAFVAADRRLTGWRP
jgi:hypothetical protein